MITKEEAVSQFKAILSAKNSWSRMATTQIVEHLAVLVSWCLREALWRVERAKQEFFLSTAINTASIMAHAEDREYLPRKREPSRGCVSITNNGDAPLTVPANSVIQANNGTKYMLVSPSMVITGKATSPSISVEQKEIKRITTNGDGTPLVGTGTAFQEVIFSLDDTASVSNITVVVAGTTWSYARLLQNTTPDSTIYDEFFTHNGQRGIRFGNGKLGDLATFGAIPPLGSTIVITLETTAGDTTVIDGTQFSILPDAITRQYLTDDSGQPASVSIKAIGGISGGVSEESVSEIAINLHYWPIYNDKLVWADDYSFFIRKHIPGTTWTRVWGEAEQQADNSGVANVDYINRIYLSAHHPSYTSSALGEKIISALSKITLLNRNFSWVAPDVSTPFFLSITGKVNGLVSTAQAETVIRSALDSDYGIDSKTRKSEASISDIYATIYATGYFSSPGTRFDITRSGPLAPSHLNTLVHINMAATTFDLGHL